MSASLSHQYASASLASGKPGEPLPVVDAGTVWGVAPPAAPVNAVPGVELPAPVAIEPVPQARRLGRHVGHPAEPPSIWVLGAHGGAGESTLARSLAGALATGHAWPHSPTPAPVLLVARSTMSGLDALRLALRDWASGATGVRLAGAAIMAAAPGGVPRPLNDVIATIAGTAPVWRIPWCGAWLEDPEPSVHSADRRTLRGLDALATALTLTLTHTPEGTHS